MERRAISEDCDSRSPVVLTALLIAGSGRLLVSALDWFAIAESLPLLVAIAVFALMRRDLGQNAPRRRLLLLTLVVALSGWCNSLFRRRHTSALSPRWCFCSCGDCGADQARAESILPVLPVMVFYVVFGLRLSIRRRFMSRGSTGQRSRLLRCLVPLDS